MNILLLDYSLVNSALHDLPVNRIFMNIGKLVLRYDNHQYKPIVFTHIRYCPVEINSRYNTCIDIRNKKDHKSYG